MDSVEKRISEKLGFAITRKFEGDDWVTRAEWTDGGHDYVSPQCKQLWDALLASERSREWTKDVPTEQGEYWHWNGDRDAAPFPLTVMWSGGNNKCFVCIKDMDNAPWCEDVGGWWMRMTAPPLPSEEEQNV